MLKLLLELLQNLELKQNVEQLPLTFDMQLNFEVALNLELLLDLELERLGIVEKLHNLGLRLSLKAPLNFEELLHFELLLNAAQLLNFELLQIVVQLLIVVVAQLIFELVDVLKVTHISCGKVGDRQAWATRPTRACWVCLKKPRSDSSTNRKKDRKAASGFPSF